MDFPSMVQRAGDKLIVRSVVSGNQLYTDPGSSVQQTCHADDLINAAVNSNDNKNNRHIMQNIINNTLLEQELKRFAQEQLKQQQEEQQQQQQNKQMSSMLAQTTTTNVKQQQQQPQQQQQHKDMSTEHTVLELKERLLPQCKIKRNYSCNYCTYFTQNPRVHLMHLRDVHGEKIVINKCKLCLYASRHFQKLVRHMKMVHGCTDGIPGGHGQSRGKRGMSREMRKRKLEQSVGLDDDVAEVTSPHSNVSGVNDLHALEQFKRELELQEQKLQREKQAFDKQQLEQQQMAVEAVLVAAYNQKREHARSVTNEVVAAKNEASSSTHSGSTSPSVNASRATPTAEERPHCRLLKCSLCEFTTLYPTQLHDHEIIKHDKTKFFRCEKCSYVTHIKARFSKHVKYHSMPMIKCITCDFRTPYKWNLDRHMKNHGGTGPFKCAACDFTADIKQSLTVHEMNHHVPPVGHAAGMALMGRRRVNKVGGTDISDDFLSDSPDLDESYQHNNLEDYDDALIIREEGTPPLKKFKYDDEEPTDLSQKCGSSDSSSIHNQQDLTTKDALNLSRFKALTTLKKLYTCQ